MTRDLYCLRISARVQLSLASRISSALRSVGGSLRVLRLRTSGLVPFAPRISSGSSMPWRAHFCSCAARPKGLVGRSQTVALSETPETRPRTGPGNSSSWRCIRAHGPCRTRSSRRGCADSWGRGTGRAHCSPPCRSAASRSRTRRTYRVCPWPGVFYPRPRRCRIRTGRCCSFACLVLIGTGSLGYFTGHERGARE